MKNICTGLIGLLLAVSPAWAVIGGGDIVIKVEGMANVLYSHDYHVSKAQLKCAACHPAVFKRSSQHTFVGMANMQKGKSCGACHNGTKAFSVTDQKHCATCHSNKTPDN